LTVAFIVNTKLVKNVPQSWADLLKPEYKNTIVYLDPRSTGVGQVVVFAANFGNGGDMNNLQPGFDYFTKLQQSGNVLRVLGTTPYAQFVKGEIPIWISYENDGLKSKYTDGLGDAVAVVIPKEASAAAPYAISLVEKGPNPDAGKLWLNFIMTDMGQGIFAQGFVRPSVPGVKLPEVTVLLLLLCTRNGSTAASGRRLKPWRAGGGIASGGATGPRSRSWSRRGSARCSLPRPGPGRRSGMISARSRCPTC